jgi:hypothetical protein
VLPGHIFEHTGRPSPSIRQDHLPQIGPMVLAVTVAAQRLATDAFEIQAGGIHHEHQVEIAPMREQLLLHQILDASQPVSAQSRSNTRAGPMRRLAIVAAPSSRIGYPRAHTKAARTQSAPLGSEYASLVGIF